MAAVDQSAVNKYNCDVMTVLIYQHNMDCIKTEPDPDVEVYSESFIEVKHNLDCIKTETDPDDEVYSASFIEVKHNLDCIKTEIDSNFEVYSASCSEIHLVDVKQEEQLLSISFSPAEDGNDVSCQCVCC
jgi:hypothetical protein